MDEDALHARLIRDLARARLYLQAVQSGYAHLVPERLHRELLDRYRAASTTDTPPPEDPE